MKKKDEGPAAGIRPALGFVAALGAVFTLGALAFFPVKTGLSVFAGALVAASNLWVLSKIVEAILVPPDDEDDHGAEGKDEPKPAPKEPKKTFSGAWGALALVKILVLFGGAWILMTRGLVDPIGLVVGYGSLPVGVSLSGLFSGLKPSKRPRT